MSRGQVEGVLGNPVVPPIDRPGGLVDVLYLGPRYAERELLPHESPFLPAGVRVTYREGRVVNHSVNTQWVGR